VEECVAFVPPLHGGRGFFAPAPDWRSPGGALALVRRTENRGRWWTVYSPADPSAMMLRSSARKKKTRRDRGVWWLFAVNWCLGDWSITPQTFILPRRPCPPRASRSHYLCGGRAPECVRARGAKDFCFFKKSFFATNKTNPARRQNTQGGRDGRPGFCPLQSGDNPAAQRQTECARQRLRRPSRICGAPPRPAELERPTPTGFR